MSTTCDQCGAANPADIHTCRAGVQAAQPAPTVQEPVAWHAMAKRRVFDAIRGAYDLGYNDARGARAVHCDSAPGYKGRDVEADHGGALISALERYTTPPAAPVQEPSPGGILFAVEEAIRNGDCPFAIEIAFDAYEAERKALAGITAAPKKGNTP